MLLGKQKMKVNVPVPLENRLENSSAQIFILGKGVSLSDNMDL